MSKLSGSAGKVFIAISRKTIGWHKDTDFISYSQIQALTGLGKTSISNAIKELGKMDLITIKRVNGRMNNYSINYTHSESNPVNTKPDRKVDRGMPESGSVPHRKVDTQKKLKETHKKKEKREQIGWIVKAAEESKLRKIKRMKEIEEYYKKDSPTNQ